jgi:tetratricopeptide (TPR) repeat protein
MQVQLTFGDQVSESGPGSVSTQNDSIHRGDAAGVERSRDFTTNMQIRVQLQDPLGGTLQESTPTPDGQVRMSVCKNSIYRLRVIGPTIQEAVLDDLHPSRGDRLVTVVLHHKVTNQERTPEKNTISATRLAVPTRAQKELEKGDEALKKKKLADARRYYAKAIELYPQFEEAQNKLGVVLMQEGDRTGGKAAFENAIAINDRFAPAYINLAKIAIDERRFSDAYVLSRQALTTEPLNPEALFVAAESAFFTRDYKQTLTYARTLHSLVHTRYALAHLLAARSLEAQNQPAAAIDEYQLFLAEDSLDPNVEMARERLRLLQLSEGVVSQHAPQ